MGQFGQDLRTERETRGVALESIIGSTKISARHLQALEREDFKALPGGVLNKGIVRGYARACGLDEDVWVHRYVAAYHDSGQLKDDDQAWIEFAANIGKSRKGDDPEPDVRLRWAGVMVFLALLACFTWYVVHFVETRTAQLMSPTQNSLMHRSSGNITDFRG
jgi:cytoskeleton protein RodZ